MTIHDNEKTLKIFKEQHTIGIHQIKWYVVGIREQKNIAVYETV